MCVEPQSVLMFRPLGSSPELVHRDEVANVAVAACDEVDGAANLGTLGNGDLDLAVDEVLDHKDGLLVHLLAVTVQQLDAVVVERVVRGRDHDAAVKVVPTADVRHRWGGGHMHDVGIGATRHKAGAQRVLKHVGRPAGVLTNDNLGLLALLGTVVPTKETTNLDGMLVGQVLVGLTTKAVSSEILTHSHVSLRYRRYS